uniref:Protein DETOXIFICATION n=1 Tax=Cajanus cajan TaxID=3821 RepID=A0A151RWQ5_CAJCA|nr:Protein TRANSPARENT TESTA 12 [Cajanus cajan]
MDTPLLLDNNEESGDYVEEGKLWNLVERFGFESKKLWKIAGPAILTSLCQYSLGALTQTFTGLVGELDLAAVAVENSVVAGLAFGIMFTLFYSIFILLGMGSALETLCGQAYGASQIRMLGVYMQRSWVILVTTALVLVPVYVWSPPILRLIGETTEISDAAGKFALWMIPQLFAYAVNFPIQKFLQAQRKVLVMLWISAVVLVLHTFFSWLLILKLGWGLTGAAITLNTSWWLIVIAQLSYIFITKSDGAWSGFTWLAFVDLFGFLKLSLASAVMLCLEFWYLMIIVVITGRLTNPLIPVDAISICVRVSNELGAGDFKTASMNINGWDTMIAIGFNAAISVRVSNELGAGDFKTARFAVWVVSITSVSIGIIVMIVVLATKDYFPYLFTTSVEVANETTKLAALLGVTVVLNSLQPVLSGVAVGAGWQSLVAYINIGCYYIVGLPAGIVLGFTFGFGVEGIWSGMIGGIALQTIILIVVTSITNWKKEVGVFAYLVLSHVLIELG